MPSAHPSYTWGTLQAALIRVGEHLKSPARLVVIGSSVGMFYGQPGRMTEDVDVWSPASKIDLADITQACLKAGVAFDPQGYDIAGTGLYLQMVKPGVVHIGKWKFEETMFVSGNLTVVHPPAENIIASKLVRCNDADIEDAVFLMTRLGLSLDTIRRGVDTLSPNARDLASENMVLLEVHSDILGKVNSFDPGTRLSIAPIPVVPEFTPMPIPAAAPPRRRARP